MYSLYHSDGVSGLTILGDGTLCLWSEGRSSYVDVIRPGGVLENVSVSVLHPINKLLDHGVAEHGGEEMTKYEEIIYNTLRGISGNARVV